MTNSLLNWQGLVQVGGGGAKVDLVRGMKDYYIESI